VWRKSIPGQQFPLSRSNNTDLCQSNQRIIGAFEQHVGIISGSHSLGQACFGSISIHLFRGSKLDYTLYQGRTQKKFQEGASYFLQILAVVNMKGCSNEH